MRATTSELLRLLQAAAPGRVFTARPAPSKAVDDGIQLANNHWLFIDSHDDPTLVRLMDETCETGGQIEFWMVRSQDVLPRIVRSALEV